MECNNHSYIMKEGERYCDKCGVVAEDNIDYSSGANPLTQTDSEGAKYKRVADKKLGSGNTLFAKNSKITTASNGKAIQTYGKRLELLNTLDGMYRGCFASIIGNTRWWRPVP